MKIAPELDKILDKLERIPLDRQDCKYLLSS